MNIICSVWLKCKAVIVVLLVVPGDSLALLQLTDIKLLGLLKIMCEVLDEQQVGRKFDLQTIETSGAPEGRTNSTSNSNIGTTNNCINIPDYFKMSTKQGSR